MCLIFQSYCIKKKEKKIKSNSSSLNIKLHIRNISLLFVHLFFFFFSFHNFQSSGFDLLFLHVVGSFFFFFILFYSVYWQRIKSNVRWIINQTSRYLKTENMKKIDFELSFIWFVEVGRYVSRDNWMDEGVFDCVILF